MFLWKSVLVLVSILTVSFPGLFVITSTYLPQQETTESKKEIRLEEKKLSKSFYQIERLIRNEEYNKVATPKKISDLTSKFEREYLESIIKKRAGDFKSQYNLLSWQLSYVPEMFRYYDELVFSARANNKLIELKEQTGRLKSQSGFKIYLISLLELTLGNYDQAIKFLSSIPNPTKEIHYLKAQSLRGLGNYKKAYSELNRAEQLSGSDREFMARVFNSKGSLLFLSGDIKKAEDFYKKANQMAKASGSREEETKSLVNLGIVADENGDVILARKLFRQALGITNRTKDPELKAFAYSELGVSYSLTNEIIEAKSYYEKSYELYNRLNNNERLSYLSSNLAAIYSQLSNFNAALKQYEQGMKFAGDNKRGQILNLMGIGDVYANLANYSKALDYYEQAKKISEEIKDVQSSASVDASIGVLLYNIGRPHKAIEFYKKAGEVIDEENNPYSAADLYLKTGLAYIDIDSISVGADYYKRGLSISKTSGDIYNEIIITTELAYSYYLMDDLKSAEETLSLIKGITKRFELTQLSNIQDLYLSKIYIAQNETKKAIPLLEKVLTSSTSISDYNTQIEAGYMLAQLSELRNDNENTEKYYRQTVNLVDELSRPLFGNPEIQIFRFSSLNQIFSDYSEFLYNQGKQEESFDIIERSRSRNTLQNLNNIKIASVIKDENLLNRLYDLDWMIKSGLYSGTELEKRKREYDTLKAKILTTSSHLKKYVNNLFNYYESNNRGNLSEDENFITINAGEKSTQLFMISKEKFLSKEINIGRDELKELIANIAPIYSEDQSSDGLYINHDLFSFNARASYVLFDKVFKPMVSEIKSGEHIVFNLPAELALLPMEFLVTEYDENGSPYYYNDKKFLIDEYIVSYSPSLSVHLIQKEKVNTDNSTILLVGDPQFNNNDFALSYRGGLLEDDSFNSRNLVLFSLEYSKEEIKNLSNLFSDSRVLISDNATESNFKKNAGSSKVIHLSTHSFLHKDQPLILFSQTDNSGNDGFLEASEILDLDLTSELVVLSSCRSGLGRIDQAEGIIGMQKAFFEAGAKSIVVSLWDVNDKYTSHFMQSFYKFLADGNDKASALQKAKLHFKANYSANPYYWSAFILSGDASRLDLIKSSGNSILYYLLLIALITTAIFFIYFRKRKV
jgi:CHAT domain-containing protein/tetratricopeptide (TPR) repeat protein